MDFNELKAALFQLAAAQKGPAASTKAFMQLVKKQFKGIPEQRILTAWSMLFREGTLSWGLDLDNPGTDYFHVSEQ